RVEGLDRGELTGAERVHQRAGILHPEIGHERTVLPRPSLRVAVMDGLRFFGLRPTEDPRQWQLPVVPRLCSGMGALFGGAGLGASVEALERVTGRPLAWATAQYLSFARPPSVLDIEVVPVVEGHQVTQ